MGETQVSFQRPTQWRYLVLFFLCVLSFLTYFDRACISRAQKDIQTDLRMDDDQMGWVMGIFFFAYAIFEIPGGWLGDRYGTRGTLIRIVLAWSLFTFLSGCALGFWTLFTCRLMFGAGEAGAYPNMARAQRQWLPPSIRARAGGLLWLTARFGAAFSPILFGTMLRGFGSVEFAEFFGTWLPPEYLPAPWRLSFAFAGLLGIMWCIAFYPWFRDDPRDARFVNDAELRLIKAGEKPTPDNHSMPGRVWKSLFLAPSLWAIGLMYVCTAFGWSFYITWLPKFLDQQHGVKYEKSEIMAGLPFIFGGLSCLVGGTLSDYVVRRTGRKWLGRALFPICGYTGAALCMAAVPFARNSDEVTILLCIANACSDFGQGANWAAIVDMGGRYAGTAAGFINMVGNAGPSIQSVVGPLIFNSFGWPALFGVYACTYIMAACMWFFIDPTKTFYRESDLPAEPHPEHQP